MSKGADIYRAYLQIQKLNINDKSTNKGGIHRPDKVFTGAKQPLMNCSIKHESIARIIRVLLTAFKRVSTTMALLENTNRFQSFHLGEITPLNPTSLKNKIICLNAITVFPYIPATKRSVNVFHQKTVPNF